jgi:hypothetical protein
MVMGQILKGALDADLICRGCRVHGTYLADQGVLFRVVAPRVSRVFSDERGRNFQIGGDNFSGIPVLRHPDGIGDLVEEVLSGLDIDIDVTADDHAVVVTDGTGDDDAHDAISDVINRHSDVKRKVRRIVRRRGGDATERSIRELNERRRDAEAQVAEVQISLLHEDDKRKKADHETQVGQLEERISRITEETDALRSKQQDQVKEARVVISRRTQETKERLAEVLTNIEDTTLLALCDYGSTLKGLPRGERITPALEGLGQDKARMHVLKAPAVTGCANVEKLKSQAVSYRF